MPRFILAASLASLLASCSGVPGLPSPLDAGTGTGQWAERRPLPQERFEAAAASIGGRIYFLGGISDLCADGSNPCVSDRVDVYDPIADQWSAGPPLPAAAPRHHLAVAVLDQKIYVVGGFTGILGGTQRFAPVGTTFVFDGAAWARLADQPIARGAATAQALGGSIYVAGGGTQEPNARADLLVYDPLSDLWQARASMPTPREHLASCVLDGKLLVVGGWRSDEEVVGAAELYDPATDQWQALSPLPTPRGGLGAAVVAGVCYVVGGEQWVGPEPGTFQNVDGLGSAGAAWLSFAPMPTRRHGIGVAVLDGQLFTVGGGPSRGNSYTNTVEVFTP